MNGEHVGAWRVDAMWEAMIAFVEGVGRALDTVEARLPDGFPDRIRGPISAGMRKQAQLFLSEAAVIQLA
jgi:serine/threonine-protein kinase HipA